MSAHPRRSALIAELSPHDHAAALIVWRARRGVAVHCAKLCFFGVDHPQPVAIGARYGHVTAQHLERVADQRRHLIELWPRVDGLADVWGHDRLALECLGQRDHPAIRLAWRLTDWEKLNPFRSYLVPRRSPGELMASTRVPGPAQFCALLDTMADHNPTPDIPHWALTVKTLATCGAYRYEATLL